jgi:hypothetical protein
MKAPSTFEEAVRSHLTLPPFEGQGPRRGARLVAA